MTAQISLLANQSVCYIGHKPKPYNELTLIIMLPHHRPAMRAESFIMLPHHRPAMRAESFIMLPHHRPAMRAENFR